MDGAQKGPDGRSSEWMPDANEFRNLRDQMFWQLREDLRQGYIAVPKLPDLFRQLTLFRYRDERIVQIETKRELKERLGVKSPNDADAVMYWNWVRPRQARERDGFAKVPEDRHPGWDYEKHRVKSRHDKHEPDPADAPRFRSIRFKGDGEKVPYEDD
jgi:hypothetical protein